MEARLFGEVRKSAAERRRCAGEDLNISSSLFYEADTAATLAALDEPFSMLIIWHPAR